MIEELLDLAIADPERGRLAAERVLAEESDPLLRSYAHQCIGIVLRDRGRSDDALREFRSGLRAARDAESPDRERDVRASYGGALAFAGRTRAAVRELDRALDGATGEVGAKIRMRKGALLTVLGRREEAVRVMRTAVEGFVRSENPGWEARARIWLGDLELGRGHLGVAEEEVRRAKRILDATGAGVERLYAVENLAEIAVARGDVASGLRLFAEAIAGYREAAQPPRFLFVAVYAAAYLSAGMAHEAVALLDEHVRHPTLPAVEQAEFHLVRATALNAVGDHNGAFVAALQARRMFGRQHRDWFELRARLAAVRARDSLHERAGLAREARDVALRLHAERADEAPAALTLAGRLARGDQRDQLWRDAASYRSHPNGLVRAGAWLAQALEREESDDRGGVLRACSSGLGAIDEHRRLMGSSELRALATTHGRELTAVALHHAASEPRALLRWSERTRATALAQPPATSDVATIPESLAALRDNGRRLAEARQAGEPTEDLERERLRLERALRAEHHTLAPSAEARQRPVSAEEVVAGVGDGCLVELVDVDGVLHVLVVHDGRVRRRVAGPTAAVAELLGPTAMLMRRAARGRPASTAELGRRLQDAILGPAARLIPDRPVVLTPTARLHGLPWALLPVLADRPFSVSPSAGQWLRARAVRRPQSRRTALISGPGLASGGAEVPELAARHPDAVLLDGPDATVEATLRALDGADLVHLAAHGSFRADSPLFSALDLADGPLVVHDLERLARAPYRVVLSACESGVLAPVGAEELLGLAAALLSLGTAGLVCSVAEVNDAATADLMLGLHAALAKGADPARALLDVRKHAAADPIAAATAASFLAVGA